MFGSTAPTQPEEALSGVALGLPGSEWPEEVLGGGAQVCQDPHSWRPQLGPGSGRGSVKSEEALAVGRTQARELHGQKRPSPSFSMKVYRESGYSLQIRHFLEGLRFFN